MKKLIIQFTMNWYWSNCESKLNANWSEHTKIMYIIQLIFRSQETDNKNYIWSEKEKWREKKYELIRFTLNLLTSEIYGEWFKTKTDVRLVVLLCFVSQTEKCVFFFLFAHSTLSLFDAISSKERNFKFSVSFCFGISYSVLFGVVWCFWCW